MTAKKLVRLPRKNLEETNRLLGNLRLHLQELRRGAEKIAIADIQKRLEKNKWKKNQKI